MKPSALFPLSTAAVQTQDTGLTFGQEQLCTKTMPTRPTGFNVFLCPVEEKAQERMSRSCPQHFPWNVMPRQWKRLALPTLSWATAVGGTTTALPGA